MQKSEYQYHHLWTYADSHHLYSSGNVACGNIASALWLFFALKACYVWCVLVCCLPCIPTKIQPTPVDIRIHGSSVQSGIQSPFFKGNLDGCKFCRCVIITCDKK